MTDSGELYTGMEADGELSSAMDTETRKRLTNYLNAAALSILRQFLAGLMTPVGLVVNSAFSENEIVRQNFSNSAYHGAVVWSWQLAAMARGLKKQLDRCSSSNPQPIPDFCGFPVVYNNVENAYNSLWDVIEENKDYEVHTHEVHAHEVYTCKVHTHEMHESNNAGSFVPKCPTSRRTLLRTMLSKRAITGPFSCLNFASSSNQRTAHDNRRRF
jgi:hypothetical protein